MHLAILALGIPVRLLFLCLKTETSNSERELMRIDKYLKVSRLIKRRTVANEVADAGRINVNGRPVKASYQVKVDDVIEVVFGNRTMRAKVLSLDAPAGKDVAREMYEILAEEE